MDTATIATISKKKKKKHMVDQVTRAKMKLIKNKKEKAVSKLTPEQPHIPIEADKKDHEMVANFDECLSLKLVQHSSVPDLRRIIDSHASSWQC